MPFTFSHPSVVLVVNKLLPPGMLSLTALVVGSIVPDFEGFLFMQTTKTISHTWPGVFFFDMPLGILLCFLWHNVVKKGFIDSLPLYFKKRFYIFRDFNFNVYVKKHKLSFAVSLFIGIFSHIFWDYYTHSNGTDITSIIVFNHELSIYIFFQYASSLLGLGIVLLFIVLMPVSRQVPVSRRAGYWFIVFEVSVIVIALRSLVFLNKLPISAIKPDEVVAVVLSSFLFGILCVSVINELRQRNRIT